MSVRSTTTDRHPQLTRLALAGVLGAFALTLFGLPPVGIHGPLHPFGVMDPLCGMTRAVRLLARGDVDGAWAYNPASFALAATAALVLVRAVVGHLTGRWLEITVRRPLLLEAALAIPVVVLWVNQQRHVALLG